MKTVFSSNSQLAHVWAQQTQPEGRANHMFFEGPTIYSYGRHFPIASFHNNIGEGGAVVLFTSRDYSVSTSKHKGEVRNALSCDFLVVDKVLPFGADGHKQNIEVILAEVESAKNKALRARENLDPHINEALSRKETLRRYIAAFRQDIAPEVYQRALAFCMADLFSPQEEEKISAQRLKNAENEKNREAIEAKRREARAAALMPALEAWKRGETVHENLYDFPIALRIKGEIVETTRGANVPLLEAAALARDVLTGIDVTGREIGHFTVNKLDGDNLIIGCHTIPLAEVERIFKQ